MKTKITNKENIQEAYMWSDWRREAFGALHQILAEKKRSRNRKSKSKWNRKRKSQRRTRDKNRKRERDQRMDRLQRFGTQGPISFSLAPKLFGMQKGRDKEKKGRSKALGRSGVAFDAAGTDPDGLDLIEDPERCEFHSCFLLCLTVFYASIWLLSLYIFLYKLDSCIVFFFFVFFYIFRKYIFEMICASFFLCCFPFHVPCSFCLNLKLMLLVFLWKSADYGLYKSLFVVIKKGLLWKIERYYSRENNRWFVSALLYTALW